MRLLFAIVFLIGLSGCGSDGGSTAKKGLFSVWQYTDSGSGATLTIDLRDGTLGEVHPFFLSFLSGEICLCDFLATGTESAGNYAFSSCTYQTGGSGDPGCSMLDSTGTYTNNGVTLTACDAGGCVSYR